MSETKPLGVVVGTFAPLHRGHIELLTQALADCDHVLVLLSEDSSGTWSFDQRREMIERWMLEDLGERSDRVAVHEATAHADLSLYTGGGPIPSMDIRRVKPLLPSGSRTLRNTWTALRDGRGNPLRHLVELRQMLPPSMYFSLLESWGR